MRHGENGEFFFIARTFYHKQMRLSIGFFNFYPDFSHFRRKKAKIYAAERHKTRFFHLKNAHLFKMYKKRGVFGVKFLLCVFLTKIDVKNRQKCYFTNRNGCCIIIVLSAAPTPTASRTIAFVKAEYQSYDIFHRRAIPVVLFYFLRAKRAFLPLELPFFIFNEEKVLKYY